MGIKGKGGKPKGKRQYSERDWQPYEDAILKRIIDEGGDYDAVAEAVGRTRTGVVLHARKIHYRMMHSTKQLTSRDAQRLLGIGCAKTVVGWIEKFHWLEGKRSGAQTIHRISWASLLAMLKNRMTWMAWSPAKIADPTMREWATEMRQGKGYWISAGDIGRRFGVGPYTAQTWIERGDFVKGDTVVKYGNWWFWSEAVEGYAPPFMRRKPRPSEHIHEMSRWELFHHQHRTAWTVVGSLVEDSGLTVTFRRGRITSLEPILTRARRKTTYPPAMLPAPSDAAHNERDALRDELVIAAGARWLDGDTEP
jgi:hypothetical protein